MARATRSISRVATAVEIEVGACAQPMGFKILKRL